MANLHPSIPVDFTKPIDYSVLKGKTALVTGGSSGLGEGFSRMFAGAGAHVVIADLNAEMGKKLEDELTAAGQSAKFVQVDVTDWPAQIAMIKAALAFSPSQEIDILVTSAGVSGGPHQMKPEPATALEDTTPPPPHKAVDINLVACFHTIHLAIKYGMGLDKLQTPKTTDAEAAPVPPPTRKLKSVVLVGSLASYAGIPGSPDYSMAKFGVRGMLRSLQGSFGGLGVRLNMLAPYFVDTPMTTAAVPILLKRGHKFARLEDTVEAIARFACDDDIHGRAVCVTVDGLTDLRDDRSGADGATALNALAEGGAISAY